MASAVPTRALTLSAVSWGVAGHIAFAWVLTIPAAAAVAAVFCVIGKALFA